MESAVIVAIVVLGGMGSLIGVALAAIMIGGTEIMRELDILKAVFGSDFTRPSTACCCSASRWC